MKYILESKVKCPECGFEKLETMSTNSCLFFYTCTNCNSLLRPKKDDCCVFCSYGSIKCPPKQKESEINRSLILCFLVAGLLH